MMTTTPTSKTTPCVNTERLAPKHNPDAWSTDWDCSFHNENIENYHSGEETRRSGASADLHRGGDARAFTPASQEHTGAVADVSE